MTRQACAPQKGFKMMDYSNAWTKRALAAFVCSAALAAVPALAQSDASQPAASQSDAPPPPPPQGGRHGGPEHRVAMLQRELNLTPDQTAQVKALFEAERTKMDALRSNTSTSQEDRRAQMMAIHQDGDTKLRALLTPEQATKYDAMQARMAQRRDGQGPPPPPPGGAPQQ